MPIVLNVVPLKVVATKSNLFVSEINIEPLEQVFAELVSDDEEPGLELGGRPPFQLRIEAPQGRKETAKGNF
jgi:hypothetical protein